MKKKSIVSLLVVMMVLTTACGNNTEKQIEDNTENQVESQVETEQEEIKQQEVIKIELNDRKVTVNGNKSDERVYITNDIVYYESDKDFQYGEGTEKDSHSKEEADEHVVVNIVEPGIYELSGTLSKGQVAVDLGEDAKENEEEVVTLILNNVDITCEVAPAIIIYNVYECGNTDTETATKDVDTSKAGANIIVADNSVNNINGSYVAKIYKPDSIVLSEDGTEVTDYERLHKYDAAFYSKMTMNINGGDTGNGVLNIKADNEGLDSELHLTINGGVINIESGNDGINTNEDGVSVTTVNGGELTIKVTGETGEGDGIDSNGWLVINGGTVKAYACSDSEDAGIDSDMGIHINGGNVIATGNMLDRIEDGGQTYVVFNFNQKQEGTEKVYLKGEEEIELTTENGYSILIYSRENLKEGTYTLWSNDKQLAGQNSGGFGMEHGSMIRPDENMGGQRPEDMELPEGMENMTPPEKPEEFEGQNGAERPQRPDGQRTEGFEGQLPEGMEIPEEFELPEGMERPNTNIEEPSIEFEIKTGANIFSNITYAE